MNLNIKEIKPNQQGANVYVLHQVLSAFGLGVSNEETVSGVAGKNTQKMVALLQRQLHISPPNNAPLLDDKTIGILVKAMVGNGMISSSKSK